MIVSTSSKVPTDDCFSRPITDDCFSRPINR